MPYELDFKKVGLKIKSARRYAALTQATLGEKCGYCTSYIANIESGKVKPSLPMFLSICNVLRLDLAETLDWNVGRDGHQTSQWSGEVDEVGLSEEQRILLRRLARVIMSASPAQFSALNSYLVENCRLYLEGLTAGGLQ